MLKHRTSRALFAVTVCLGLSLTINVFQGTRILTLQGDMEQLLVQGDLPPGTSVPNLEVSDLSGQSRVVQLRTGSKPTVLYIFTPSCAWCMRNNVNINSLAKQVSARYRVVGLSLSRAELPEYVKAHDLRFPVYTDLPRNAMTSYKLGRTPETIVVSPDGVVVQSWVGAYVGGVRNAIEQYFTIRFPDEQRSKDTSPVARQ